VTIFDDLEDPPESGPLFFVEAPDGRTQMTEIMRVVAFRKLLRATAGARVLCFPNANAGKRDPRRAAAEGIMAGVADYTVVWSPSQCAFIEFKGYSKAGRPGKLSLAQVEWGNTMHRHGHAVACFFDAAAAVAWLRECGAPVSRAAYI
tara:strand:+ start:668 stop:1111 length:444 start_codon:yes stop_codon:yes gene_type:complete